MAAGEGPATGKGDCPGMALANGISTTLDMDLYSQHIEDN